jgi:hypothetical protein
MAPVGRKRPGGFRWLTEWKQTFGVREPNRQARPEALRVEACSTIVARHTGSAQDCEYEVAWANTYKVGIQYTATATATRCSNAVPNRHRAPQSRLVRALAGVSNVRAAAFAQIGIVGLDGQIELEALRLFGLPEAVPALLCGTPTLPVGQRELVAEVPFDLPSLSPGAVLVDVTVTGARQGDRAEASLASSTRFIELDAFTWTNNTVRVMARNISGSSFDLGAATLSVAVTKRRIP